MSMPSTACRSLEARSPFAPTELQDGLGQLPACPWSVQHVVGSENTSDAGSDTSGTPYEPG